MDRDQRRIYCGLDPISPGGPGGPAESNTAPGAPRPGNYGSYTPGGSQPTNQGRQGPTRKRNKNNMPANPGNVGFQDMILQAFSSEVYDPNKMDVQHEPLYDTITKAAAATIVQSTDQFFTNVGPQSGKTLASTNLTTPGQLQSPEAFSIMAIRFRWQENILNTDLFALLSSFALSFVMGQKSYNRAPLWHYNAGGGVFAFTTQTNQSYLANGAVGRNNMHVLDIPLVIENTQRFFAMLEGNTVTLTAAASGGTGAVLQLLLDGYHARGVQ